MKIAVVGAGVFGCVTAIKLAAAGHKVFLFEKERSILKCASGINQYRLHRGYHYPRSRETVEYVKESSLLFEEEFPSAICREGFDRYYAISSEDSLISPDQYLTFLSDNNLAFEVIDGLSIVRENKVDLLVKVVEHGFDLSELYLTLSRKLSTSNVSLRTYRAFARNDMKDYDLVINATYANINSLLEDDMQVEYQYELCEKPVVRLQEHFHRKSVVILDGEFCCIDPVGFNTTYQVLGHVKEAIHERQVGKHYEVPQEYKNVINRGNIHSPISRFSDILNGVKEYFNVEQVTHLGSMYTVRTVLPQHEHDDARPSNIIKHSDSLYSIFSGKIGTCVDIANKLVKQL